MACTCGLFLLRSRSCCGSWLTVGSRRRSASAATACSWISGSAFGSGARGCQSGVPVSPSGIETRWLASRNSVPCRRPASIPACPCRPAGAPPWPRGRGLADGRATRGVPTTTAPTTARSASARWCITAPARRRRAAGRPADAAQNQADFDARVRVAEDAVRNGVPGRLPNQNQFDAVVSAAYNSGGGMTRVFAQADRGNDIGVVDQMHRNVIIHRHDAQGHRVGPPVVSRGLINRRAGEIARYNGPIAPVPARGRP